MVVFFLFFIKEKSKENNFKRFYFKYWQYLTVNNFVSSLPSYPILPQTVYLSEIAGSYHHVMENMVGSIDSYYSSTSRLFFIFRHKAHKKGRKECSRTFLSEQILTSQLMIIMELGGAVER